ncbi:MAG TPA: response regulator transcription factor [Thermoanaerobaculia bacterium]|jgi:DNA-binding NarL/FixJ family response regulator|nr:response regulator transcription factor [Thermoanaerobaculia bacterium]
MPGGEPIRVAIIEDDYRARDALRQLLDGTPGYRCVGAFGSVAPALAARLGELPDVLLLDIQLPGVAGSDAVGALRQLWPGAVVVMLTIMEDEDEILRSLCNGAHGYILKRTPPARLLEAVADAKNGGAPMSPEIASIVVDLLRRIPPPEQSPASLSKQEIRLLALLAEGCSYQAAADELGVTINTVRSYIRNIYEKLQVHTKSAAVSRAIRSRLLW